MEKAEENSQKVKKSFQETYKSTLNEKFSSIVLRFKEGFLNLKSYLLNDLKRGIHNLIEKKIKQNYENYQKFIIENLKTFCEQTLEKNQGFTLIFNERDFNYFNEHKDLLTKAISYPFQLEKGKESIRGGFKINLEDEKISYDYTIKNLLDHYSEYMEKEFSKIVSDKGINQLQQKFEGFITKKKSEMEEYLEK